MERTIETVQAEIARAKANKKKHSHLVAELKGLINRRLADSIASNGHPVNFRQNAEFAKLNERFLKKAQKKVLLPFISFPMIFTSIEDKRPIKNKVLNKPDQFNDWFISIIFVELTILIFLCFYLSYIW